MESLNPSAQIGVALIAAYILFLTIKSVMLWLALWPLEFLRLEHEEWFNGLRERVEWWFAPVANAADLHASPSGKHPNRRGARLTAVRCARFTIPSQGDGGTYVRFPKRDGQFEGPAVLQVLGPHAGCFFWLDPRTPVKILDEKPKREEKREKQPATLKSLAA